MKKTIKKHLRRAICVPAYGQSGSARRLRRLSALLLAALAAALPMSGCAEGYIDISEIKTEISETVSVTGSKKEGNTAEWPAAVNIMLPVDKAAFGEELSLLAAADGVTLVVHTAQRGAGYGAAVQKALSGVTPPDIVWVEGEGDMQELGPQPLYNFEGEDAGEVMRAFSELVPGQSRFPGEGKLLGLPLGYYAEGYIVNLELLRTLLGSVPGDGLLQDLYSCSWEEWVLLIRALESILAQPGKIELQLGGKRHATASFRPNSASALRGIFAVPTMDTAGMIGNALDLLMGLSYTDARDLDATAYAEKEVIIETILPSLLGVLELETMHMTQATGPLRRGEGYSQATRLTADAAKQLFIEGRALFLRGDSRLAAALEKESPQLSGCLALTPVKLPPTGYLDEGGSEGAAIGAQEGGASVIETTPLPEEEQAGSDTGTGLPGAIDAAAADKVIENSNLGLWYASDGLLCISQASKVKPQAQSLLLRLYTTAKGQFLLQNSLGLYIFSSLYPSGRLARQVSAEVVAGGWRLVAAPTALVQAKTVLGSQLQGLLLEEYHWDESLQSQFYATGAVAISAIEG